MFQFKKLKLNISLWPYALVILAIILPWFLHPGYLFFTDNVWGPNLKLDWTSSWFLFNLLVKGLSFIFSVAFLEKIWISGILILIALGGRLLVKTISEPISSGLVFVLSLFALFNPFVYDRALYGQFGILIAYGCVFYILAYLFKAWRTKDFKNLYPAAVFTAIALMFSVHFIFLLLPFYILFFIAVCRNKKFWLPALISITIVLILNANWLIALAINASPLSNFVSQGITNQDLTAFATAGASGPETLSNVLLMSGFWGKDQFRYLDLTKINGWQKSFIFLTPLIFYGLYLSFKKNKVLSLGLIIIFIIAVLLAMGIKSDLTRSLTLFLYDHLPLYKGLREPQKWVAIIVPIYLFFLTLGASQLAKVKIVKNNQVLSGIILAAVIIMGAPSLLWGFNRQVVATKYPSDWAQVNNLVSSPNCSERILFLPWHMYLSFNWAGKIMANPAAVYFSCPVASGTNMEWGGIYDNSLSSEGQAVATWIAEQGKFQSPMFSSTSTSVLIEGPNLTKGSGLAVNSIHYIILAKEVDYSSYSWLNDLSYVKPVLETPTLKVYELK